jgi:hypothetical protein
MKKIYILSFLFVVITIQNINAQKLGYLGKRFLFNLDTKIAIDLEDFEIYPFMDESPLTFIYSPSFEYVVGKNTSLGLGLNYFSKNLDVYYNDQDYSALPFYVFGATFTYKHYINGSSDYYQAPFGVFYAIKLDYMHYILNFPTMLYDDRLIGAKFEIGADYIVWKRLRLSWGFSIGLTNYILDSDILSFSKHSGALSSQMNNIIKNSYLINNRFGIGILLF